MEVRRIKLRQTDKPADRPPGHREIGKVNFQLNIDDRDSGNTNLRPRTYTMVNVS